MTTSDRIRQRRLELGLTQLEVAKRIGLTTKAAVCKIEKQGNDVTLKNVERFAKALNCSPAYLMGWEEENENKTQIDKLDIQADREARFLELYSRLSDYEKNLIDNMLTTLTSKK
jgi:transcriptional regulator with XRE-family HTH domain